MDTKTLIIIALVVIGIIGVVAFLTKGLKFALCLILIFLLFTVGFLWLPGKVQSVVNGDMTVNEVIECVKEDGCGIKDSINQGLDLIKDSTNEVKNKLIEDINKE